MTTLGQLDSYGWSDGFEGHISAKTLVLWGTKGNVSQALAFIHRPNGVSPQTWAEVRAAFRNTVLLIPKEEVPA